MDLQTAIDGNRAYHASKRQILAEYDLRISAAFAHADTLPDGYDWLGLKVPELNRWKARKLKALKVRHGMI